MEEKLYQNRDWLYKQYTEKGLSQSEIGNLVGKDGRTIGVWMGRFNIPVRPKGPKEKPYKEEEWLREHYQDKKMTQNEIGKLVGVDGGTISYWLRKYNIPTRRNFINEIGNIHGHLKVIGQARSNKWGEVLWKCICTRCGSEAIVSGSSLRTGHTKSCGCLKEDLGIGELIDETGNIYGELQVIKRAENDKIGNPQWLCRCSCGKEAVFRASNLRRGKVMSCGCQRMLPEGESSFNALLKRYIHDADKRNLKWGISVEDFRRLTKKNCFYCGSPPSATHSVTNGHGHYTYNGIDRVDNNKGYVLENCVPCCKRCNYAKGKISTNEFLSWAKRLAEYQGWT